MSKVFIEESTLTAIGDAIRAKNGSSELIAPQDMDTAITNLSFDTPDIPDIAFNRSGSLAYAYYNGVWDWFLDTYGEKVITSYVSNISQAFYNSGVEIIPFSINFQTDYYDREIGYGIKADSAFFSCDLVALPVLNKFQPNIMDRMLYNCLSLTDISTLYNANYMYLLSCKQLFSGCYALRTINSDLLSNLQLYSTRLTPETAKTNTLMNQGFMGCLSLDELIGVPVDTYNEEIASNMFFTPFSYCSRLKNLIFKATTGNVKWSNQSINLSEYLGYVEEDDTTYLKNFGGFTDSTRITNDTDYQILKNNPNSWTTDVAYSRYNKDSAIATINSLPTTTGTSNVIKFIGNSGSKTDGGAINTMTAEEIAVATAKGFTVSFV